MRVSTGQGGESLTAVGKPAPPRPTMPHSFTRALISSGVGSERAGNRNSSPLWSARMTRKVSSPPPCAVIVRMSVTSPAMLAKTSEEMAPSAFAMHSPRFTFAPFSTQGRAGRPSDCEREMHTSSGGGSCSRGFPLESCFLPCGWMPANRRLPWIAFKKYLLVDRIVYDRDNRCVRGCA